MPQRAAIYLRISSDPSGKRLGVVRQLKECQALATAKRWPVVRIFEDNDFSASTGKPRPAYLEMLAAMEAGHVDGVIVWDLDRLTRRPMEMETFIDLADRKRVALATVGGDADLSTDSGRLFARIKGAVARAEIERKSARQMAANDQRAESGQPPAGRRAYGYSPDGLRVVESEAVEFRQAVNDLLEGASIRSIAADMNGRGARTTAGNPWKPTELRRLLQNPRHAGLRVHRGVVIGPGVWPAVIDQDAHRAVCAILRDPARRTAGPPRRHFLSGLARCGVCGGTIYGVSEPRGVVYYCRSRRHVARRAEHVDALVHETMIDRLSRPDVASLLAPADTPPNVADLHSEEQRVRRRMDGLAEAYAVGDIDAHQLRAGSKRLRNRLDVIEDELAEMGRRPTLGRLMAAKDVRAAWEGLSMDGQRESVAALMTITLHSPGRGARTFDPRSVAVEWKTA